MFSRLWRSCSLVGLAELEMSGGTPLRAFLCKSQDSAEILTEKKEKNDYLASKLHSTPPRLVSVPSTTLGF
jgi:hypothetical protein